MSPPKPKVVLMPTRTRSSLARLMSKRKILLPKLTTSRRLLKIGHAGADGFRRNFAVAARGRGENVAVGLVVEFGNGAVVAFIRVGGAGFCKCRGGSEPDQQEDGVGGFS